jgi:hypothetical protein
LRLDISSRNEILAEFTTDCQWNQELMYYIFLMKNSKLCNAIGG